MGSGSTNVILFSFLKSTHILSEESFFFTTTTGGHTGSLIFELLSFFPSL